MAVRTYYGTERVTVPGAYKNGVPDPTAPRLAGTVSGVAMGLIVVGLDEPSQTFPQLDEEGSYGPGLIAQVNEQDIRFLDGSGDAADPGFTQAQLDYIAEKYGAAKSDTAQDDSPSSPRAGVDLGLEAGDLLGQVTNEDLAAATKQVKG